MLKNMQKDYSSIPAWRATIARRNSTNQVSRIKGNTHRDLCE